MNLYEILGLDEQYVLNSYLKGENNDPKQKTLELDVSLHSIDIILTKEKQNNEKSKNYQDFLKIKMFKNVCKCS